MDGVRSWMTALVMSLMNVLTVGYSVERYDIVIYQNVETRNSSLSCLFCFNGDATNDCMTLKNISNIPTKTCMQHEPYCKVRRLHKDGDLVTFDRYCASYCKPGCTDAARYLECVSCCNHKSECNVDNAAPNGRPIERYPALFILTILMYLLGQS
ncbi:unnamed protein product [Candidula unifasciata]|uniref:Uncharacterized protein n=1 Tax=Candidula unifasciata TaxID=100452 RepID=A0A8S3ZEY1_9EUPU|nr:unnamed protein product [Candidula unifasciata]